MSRKAFSTSIMCKQIKAHAFTISAEVQGPNKIDSPKIIGSFSRRKKELTTRPVLPWHIPMHGDCSQTHALSRIQIEPNALPDRLHPQNVGERLCLHHCEASFHQLEPTLSHRSSAVRLFQALQGFVQSHNWVFEVLFPQFQSRFISSQNVVFAFWVIKILSTVYSRIHLPKGLCLLTCIWLPYSPLPYSFLCGARTIPPIRCLQFLSRLLGKRHTNQRLPRAVPTSPPLCDRH